MEEAVRRFLENNHSAVMATTKKDGTTHLARIGVGLVDGKLWSSATKTRVRTKHLRRDSRSGLLVMNLENRYEWLGLETTVTILEDDDAPQLNLRLYRALAGEPEDVDEYLEAMVKEQRIIYEFSIERAYGDYPS